jgi:hypothetical protein
LPGRHVYDSHFGVTRQMFAILIFPINIERSMCDDRWLKKGIIRRNVPLRRAK